MASDREIKKKLDEADWDSIYSRLLAFAERLKRLYSGNYGQLPRGFTPKDIVQTVIEKAYSGTRKWNPDKGDLFPWLINIAKSEVSNLYDKNTDKHKRRREVPISNHDSEDDGADEHNLSRLENNAIHDVFPNMQSLLPENLIIKREDMLERCRIINEAIDEDDELFELYSAMIETSQTEPRKLAQHMQVDVKEIYKRKQRLKYRLDKQNGTEDTDGQ